jgi:Arc/MetJ-type ribon-helix-helix transcriptional regulator
MDAIWMCKMPHNLVRVPVGESEKLTINVGVVDLGQIDLLVKEGFYANRSDLIRTALRSRLDFHREDIQRLVIRRVLCLGLQDYSRAALERVVDSGERLSIRVVGLVRIANDVTPELATAAIEEIEVLGAFQASRAVKDALAQQQARVGHL